MLGSIFCLKRAPLLVLFLSEWILCARKTVSIRLKYISDVRWEGGRGRRAEAGLAGCEGDVQGPDRGSSSIQTTTTATTTTTITTASRLLKRKKIRNFYLTFSI